MNLLQEFEIAFGSTQGVRHKQKQINNQDAATFRKTSTCFAGVVCDGCGSAPYAEVGSRLISELIVESLVKGLELEEIQTQVISMINQISLSFQYPKQMLSAMFTTTIVGFRLDHHGLKTFSFGDGVIIENEKIIYNPTFDENAPPYLVYRLTGSTMFQSDSLYFIKNDTIPIDQVQSCLIGTDGVSDLIELSHSQKPGKNELVGDISQFWLNDKFFTFDSYLQAYLCSLTTDVYKTNSRLLTQLAQTGQIDDKARARELFQKYYGLLPDDTSMVVLRRKPQ